MFLVVNKLNMKRRAYPRATQLKELVLHLYRATIPNYSQGNTLNQTVGDSNYFLPKPGDYKTFSFFYSNSSLTGVSGLRQRARIKS